LDNTNSAIGGGLSVAAPATVQIGNNNGNGTLPLGGITVDGNLVFKRTVDSTVAQAITGAGNLSKFGSSKLTLTGANSYAGVTTATNGTLAISGSGSIASSSQVNITTAGIDITGANAPVGLGPLN